jgi:hypothetical protein
LRPMVRKILQIAEPLLFIVQVETFDGFHGTPRLRNVSELSKIRAATQHFHFLSKFQHAFACWSRSHAEIIL